MASPKAPTSFSAHTSPSRDPGVMHYDDPGEFGDYGDASGGGGGGGGELKLALPGAVSRRRSNTTNSANSQVGGESRST